MRIECHQVSKRFGRVEALRSVDLVVPPGRRVALIGPNGSGKSTLTRALMGLIGVSGSITVDGLSPRTDRPKLAKRLGYVPQVAPHMRAPLVELVRAVARVRDMDPSRVAELAGDLGLDLAAVADRDFRDLSGGMKQKLLIALALAPKPSLLVLDEPTASLDVAARERFFAACQAATEATIILCSHRLEEIRHLVDHVVALEDGRLAYNGTAAEYLALRAFSRVEVQVDNGCLDEWLNELGFSKRLGGWWAGLVAQEDKLRVLTELLERRPSGVHNVLVRDLERLDDGGSDD